MEVILNDMSLFLIVFLLLSLGFNLCGVLFLAIQLWEQRKERGR